MTTISANRLLKSKALVALWFIGLQLVLLIFYSDFLARIANQLVANRVGEQIVGRKMFFLFTGTIALSLRASSWERILALQQPVIRHLDRVLIAGCIISTTIFALLAANLVPATAVFPFAFLIVLQIAILAPERAFGLELRSWAIVGALVSGFTVVLSWVAHRAEHFSEKLWDIIHVPVLHLLSNALALSGLGNTLSPEKLAIKMRSTTLIIEAGCAGFAGVGLVSALFTGYLVLARPTKLRIGIPTAYGVLVLASLGINFLRLFALSAIAGVHGVNVTFEAFHSAVGWFLSAGLFLGFVSWLESPVAGQNSKPQTLAFRPIEEPCFRFLAPLLVMSAASLACTGLDTYVIGSYSLRILVGAVSVVLVKNLITKFISVRDAVIGCLLGILTFAIWMGFDRYSSNESGALVSQGLVAGPWFEGWRPGVIRTLGSTLVVPFAEELAFRGYLMRRISGGLEFFKQPYSGTTFLGITLSSLVFGAAHKEVVAAVLCGVVFSLAAKWTNRLSTAVIAHGVCNFLIAMAAIFFHQRQLWA